MEQRYRCQLERFGAPPWTCRLVLALLALLIAAYALLITAAASSVSRSKIWFLPLIWLLVALALWLLFRGWRASRLHFDGSSGPKEPPGSSSSNNRLERP